jgi:hypothetical protein
VNATAAIVTLTGTVETESELWRGESSASRHVQRLSHEVTRAVCNAGGSKPAWHQP